MAQGITYESMQQRFPEMVIHLSTLELLKVSLELASTSLDYLTLTNQFTRNEEWKSSFKRTIYYPTFNRLLNWNELISWLEIFQKV